jgi:hypothetical protein
MKVDGPGSVRSPSAKRAVRGGASDSGSFAKELARAGETTGATGAVALSGVQGLVAPASVEDATQRARRSRARADALLERLDEIRAALLSGILPRDTIAHLGDLVRSTRDEVDDPGLRALLDEIDLRAQVELAKIDSLG